MRRDGGARDTLILLLSIRGVGGENVGGSSASAAVGGLWVGGVRREVARGIIGLVSVTGLLVGHGFPSRRTLMNGHAEFGGHVGRRLASHAIPRLRPAWRGK